MFIDAYWDCDCDCDPNWDWDWESRAAGVLGPDCEGSQLLACDCA